MKKRVLSLICITALAAALTGCGSDSVLQTENENVSDSIDVAKVNLGDNEVVVTPSSSEVVSDNYAFTTSDLGLVTMVKSSEPVDVNSSSLIEDTKLDNIIKTSSPYIVSSKVIPKPITSADGKVSMILQFDPKLKFDTTVSITNYNSLLALPNNGLDLLKEGLKPLSSVSSDIAFYNSYGERIWDINDKFKNEDTNVRIYLVFDESNPDLKEGNYTLAYYKENGDLIKKDILIKPKSDGKLEVALDGVYPFIIAEKNTIDPKQIFVASDFNKTDFELPVVAFDSNGSVVGIGKATNATSLLNPPEADYNYTQNTSNYVYLINDAANYKIVSYLLKNGFKEFDSNSTTITADDLNPEYPLVDNMNYDDMELIQDKMKNKIQTEENIFAINDYEYPEDYYCNNNYINSEFCNDFKNTLLSIFENSPNNTLKSEYISENNTTCNVTSSLDENKSTITVKCTDGMEDVVNISKKIDESNSTYFEISFNLKDVHSNESGNYNLYISNDNTRYVDAVLDKYTESYTSNSGDYTYSETNSINIQIERKKGVYYYRQDGSISESGTYESNEGGGLEKYSHSFKYELSKKMHDYVNEVPDSYAVKIYDISSSDEVTINGKTLVINKDSSGFWHINNSIDGY